MSSSVSESLNVPFMETRWDYDFKRSPFSISVHPHPSMLGRAYADYVTKVNPGWSLQLCTALHCCAAGGVEESGDTVRVRGRTGQATGIIHFTSLFCTAHLRS